MRYLTQLQSSCCQYTHGQHVGTSALASALGAGNWWAALFALADAVLVMLLLCRLSTCVLVTV